jgi:transcription antitermination factor NusG
MHWSDFTGEDDMPVNSSTPYLRATGSESKIRLPDCGRWHLLHTKSRQEKLLADELQRMGIDHFLPLITQNRLYGKRKFKVELPLFPGYVFLRGSIEDAYQASRTRVARIIEVVDQAHLQWELANLSMALSTDVSLDPFPFLKKGLRVEVRSGPLRGLQGLIEHRLATDRLVLQIELLGRAMSLEVDGAELEPL